MSKTLILISILFLNISSAWADSAEEHLYSGNVEFKLDNFDQAILEYTKAIDLNPNLAKAYDNRGVAYAQEGSLPRAIADFTMAIANNPNDGEAYNNRGHAYAAQGNFTQAIHDYSKAIGINSIYVKAYNNRAQAYYNLKDYINAWSDVYEIEALGSAVDPYLLQELKQASVKASSP